MKKTNGTTNHRTNSTDRSMSASLRSKCHEIVAMLSKATSADARARHRIGVIVAEIMERADKYGNSGVERAAAEIGLSPAALYSYAAVAKAWDATQFDALLERRNARGVPLTFSHCVLLAAVDDADARDDLAEQARVQGLSVDDLKVIIAGKAEARRRSGTIGKVSLSAGEGIEDIVPVVDTFLAQASHWTTSLTALNGNGGSTQTTAHLTASIEKLRELQKVCADAMAAIEGKLEEIGSAHMEPSTPIQRLETSAAA